MGYEGSWPLPGGLRGFSVSGMIMFVPGKSGNPPSIRMVTPPLRSWLTCASRGCSKTATLEAASMRAANGTRWSRITASRNCFGLRSPLLYSCSTSGARTSPSTGLAMMEGVQTTDPRYHRGRDHETWLRALRPLSSRQYHSLYPLTRGCTIKKCLRRRVR